MFLDLCKSVIIQIEICDNKAMNNREDMDVES